MMLGIKNLIYVSMAFELELLQNPLKGSLQDGSLGATQSVSDSGCQGSGYFTGDINAAGLGTTLSDNHNVRGLIY